jgi:hypothetical protein
VTLNCLNSRRIAIRMTRRSFSPYFSSLNPLVRHR